MAGLVPAISIYEARCPDYLDHRDIGERSDAVLRTTMPGDDNRGILPCPNQRQRLVALIKIQQATQRLATFTRELRIVLHHA